MSPLVNWWFRLLFLSKSDYPQLQLSNYLDEQPFSTEGLQANQQLEREIEGES
jgi:hypothetical protein